ncbi:MULTISPECIES: hypothetical protein [Streptomyces]|uniref:hypothetical protein n=1 Tax=Streptomyces TaxID=1883 RepID=UPI0034434B10
MQAERAEQYGRCAAILEQDFQVPGAGGVFDQALTNGLAAIVAHEWPGEESAVQKNGDRRMKAASGLLAVIRTHLDESTPGVRTISDKEVRSGTPFWGEDEDPPTFDVTIEVDVLLDALDQTQPVRHARGIGALTEAHVDALIKLDDHISLRRLPEARQDSEWVKDQIRDRYEQQRAADYLHLIGEAEAERRASGAIEYLPADPKERLLDFGLVECPVCSYEALRVTGMDDAVILPSRPCSLLRPLMPPSAQLPPAPRSILPTEPKAVRRGPR